MLKVDNLFFDKERALYNLTDAEVYNCNFWGPQDGESALKEARNVYVNQCQFSLRYPLWHNETLFINRSHFHKTARAPLWYCSDVNIYDTFINSVKTLRECEDIYIYRSNIISEEFAWRCSDLVLEQSTVEGFYAFFESKNIELNECVFKGKYSFQYVDNAEIINSDLDTKDAFWHSNNVTVKNSIVKGEYLGWYSNNLTFINCVIIGTQPLCYCKNLKLINCEMVHCDLAFEYSDVEADIKGNIKSIKNPSSGKISCKNVGEIILENAVFSTNCEIEIRDNLNK